MLYKFYIYIGCQDKINKTKCKTFIFIINANIIFMSLFECLKIYSKKKLFDIKTKKKNNNFEN